MKIKMRKNRVLLRVAQKPTTESGIVLTDDMERDIREVLSVGEGVEDFKPGDKVLVNHMTVRPVEVSGVVYGVCLDEAIYGVIGEGEEIVDYKKESTLFIPKAGLIL